MPIRRGTDERFNAALDQRVPSSWHVECKERIDDLPGTLSSEQGSSCGPPEDRANHALRGDSSTT